MKIKNIKINNYGNLENKEINLQNKINIIYGKNESGKSTLLNYIKNIFYGISKNKNGKEISDYEKYNPWGKQEFSGKIKYELDNGNEFEIFRNFHKKNPEVYNGNMEEISKEYNIDKKDGVQFFYDQTKVDETMFLSTVVSMQQEVKLDKSTQQVLVQKLANLAGTGDDNTSFKKVLDKLNKKQLEEIGTERTSEKPINVVKGRLREIEFVKKDTILYKNEKAELEQKKTQEKNEISKLEMEKNVTAKLKKVYDELKIEKERNALKNNLKIENEEKLKKLNIEKNNLIENKNIIEQKIDNYNKEKNKKNNNKKINIIKYILILFLFLLIIFGVILKIINFNFIKNNIINYFIYLIIPIYLIILLIKKIIYNNNLQKNKLNKKLEEEKIKNEINILNIKIEEINKQINEYEKEINNQKEEIENNNKIIENKLDNEIENIRNEYENSINIDYILDTINWDLLNEKLEETQEKLKQKYILLNSIEIEEKNISLKLDNYAKLEEEYENLNDRLKELEEKTKYINLTKEYLNKAYEKMKKSITPKFTENLSNNISNISNNKYNKVSLNEENGLIVENEKGEYIPAERLSVGTIDQLYLSLRLSMIDEISEEKMPIMLDEAFAYYDEERLENILKYLVNKTDKNQVIIFTCTLREQKLLDKLGVSYNLVELS